MVYVLVWILLQLHILLRTDNWLEGPSFFLSFAAAVGIAAFVMTAIPVFVLVVLAEKNRWRHLGLHLFCGLAVGTMAITLFIYIMPQIGGRSDMAELAHAVIASAVAGTVAGWVYWFLSGQNAGAARRQISG